MKWGTAIKPTKKGIESNSGLTHKTKAICLGYIGKTKLSISVLRAGYKVPQKYHVDFWEPIGRIVVL